MRRASFTVLGMVLATAAVPVPAIGQVQQAWFSQVNGTGNSDDSGDHLAIDAAGNIVVAGRVGRFAESAKLLVSKRDPAGNVLWSRVIDPTPPAIIEEAPFVEVDHGGAILVAWQESIWQSGAQVDAPVRLAKIAPDGTDVWRVTYDPAAFVRVFDAEKSPDDGLVIAGSSSTGNDSTFWTLKVSGSGAVQWEDRFAPSRDRAMALAVAVDSTTGEIAVGGETTNFTSTESVSLVVRYDAGGRRSWWKRISSSSSMDERVHDVAIDPSGDTVAVGLRRERATGHTEGFVTKLTARQGRSVWTRFTNPSVVGASLDLVGIDASGSVVAAGSADAPGGTDRLVLGFTGGGVARFAEQLDTRLDDVITALAVRADGNAYVTGYAIDGNAVNPTIWLTSRFDPATGHVWDATVDVATYHDWDKGLDIGLTATGAIVVTGRTLNVVAPPTLSGDETTIEYVEP